MLSLLQCSYVPRISSAPSVFLSAPLFPLVTIRVPDNILTVSCMASLGSDCLCSPPSVIVALAHFHSIGLNQETELCLICTVRLQ
jgi:hypothetical protein